MIKKGEEEGYFASMRALELIENPVLGCFGSKHLREVNRRIFQDFPALGLDHVAPGQYRPPVSKKLDWYKERNLELMDKTSFVVYSKMDVKAQKEMNAILEALNEKIENSSLSKMSKNDFTLFIASLYVSLDYIHPFVEGNSRTLRAFTLQVANSVGFDINWENFNSNSYGRNILYIARDISVNRIAINRVHNSKTRQIIDFNLGIFQNNRDLPDLMKDAVFRLENKSMKLKKPKP